LQSTKEIHFELLHVVIATNNSTSYDHPKGTWVQPYTHNDASLP
jgi:hypothetical protein